MEKKISDLDLSIPIHVEGGSLLLEGSNLLKEKQVDTVCVVEGRKPIGMLDIQDIIGLGN